MNTRLYSCRFSICTTYDEIILTIKNSTIRVFEIGFGFKRRAVYCVYMYKWVYTMICIWNTYNAYFSAQCMSTSKRNLQKQAKRILLKRCESSIGAIVAETQHTKKLSKANWMSEKQRCFWDKKKLYLRWRRSFHRWCYAKIAIYTHRPSYQA